MVIKSIPRSRLSVGQLAALLRLNRIAAVFFSNGSIQFGEDGPEHVLLLEQVGNVSELFGEKESPGALGGNIGSGFGGCLGDVLFQVAVDPLCLTQWKTTGKAR